MAHFIDGPHYGRVSQGMASLFCTVKTLRPMLARSTHRRDEGLPVEEILRWRLRAWDPGGVLGSASALPPNWSQSLPFSWPATTLLIGRDSPTSSMRMRRPFIGQCLGLGECSLPFSLCNRDTYKRKSSLQN